MKKILLFDLDGTLLPQDQDEFVATYFEGIKRNFKKLGYDVLHMMQGMQEGIVAMATNQGKKTNEEAFWDAFSTTTSVKKEDVEGMFEKYYKTEFKETMGNHKPYGGLKAVLETLKNKGYRLFLATNPLFPAVSTHERIRWAGLNPELFEDITTYETSRYAKPQLGYYQEIIQKNNIDPAEAMMIGNDMLDDYVATKLGMDFFLITDFLINKQQKPLPANRATMKEFLIHLRYIGEKTK